MRGRGSTPLTGNIFLFWNLFRVQPRRCGEGTVLSPEHFTLLNEVTINITCRPLSIAYGSRTMETAYAVFSWKETMLWNVLLQYRGTCSESCLSTRERLKLCSVGPLRYTDMKALVVQLIECSVHRLDVKSIISFVVPLMCLFYCISSMKR